MIKLKFENLKALNKFRRKLKTNPIEGTIGIGHTRWATHGEPSDVNVILTLTKISLLV